MSLPSSSAVKPAASAAAAPPDDPPGVRRTSHGLWVVPYTGLKLCQSASEAGTLLLPKTTAPAFLSRCTAKASAVGMLWRYASWPQVVGRPATLNDSFTVIGTPCSGPQSSPRASAASACCARWRARSVSSTGSALMALPSRAMRARVASSSSSADSDLRRMRRASSVAGKKIRSSMFISWPAVRGPAPVLPITRRRFVGDSPDGTQPR